MAEKWLTLSDTTKLLGVHRNTVRLWSDKGILPVYRTQGGHRRYKRREILLWARSNEKPWVAALEPENMLCEILKNVRIQISEKHLEGEPWYQELDSDARKQYRLKARGVLQGLINYISTTGEDASMEAYVIGYEYASHARHYNLSYTNTVKAFHFFYAVLIESVTRVCIAAHVPVKRMAEIYAKMDRFTREVLISLLETYRKLESVNS